MSGSFFLVLLLICLGAGLYSKSAHYPFASFDDPGYITENADVQNLNLTNIKRYFTHSYISVYVPIVMLSFAVDYHYFGMDAFASRRTNILVHLLSSILVFLIARKYGLSEIAAFGTAVLFMVHPVQVESVVWISQRKNLLFGFFSLLAFYLYLQKAVWGGEKKYYFYALIYIVFLLACLAKAFAVMLPVLFLLHDFLFKRQISRKWILFLLSTSLIFSSIAMLILRKSGELSYHGGSILAFIPTFFVVLASYLRLLCFPFRLGMIYPFKIYPWIDITAWSSLLLVVGIATLLIIKCRKSPGALFGLAWVGLWLLPAINLVPQSSLMQDRWLYLPIAGLLAVFFGAIRSDRLRCLMIFFAFIYLLPLNLRAQENWKNPENMWESVIRQSPDQYAAPYANLGVHYLTQGRFEDAQEAFEKGMLAEQTPEIISKLGIIAHSQAQYELSEVYFRKAMELAPEKGIYRNALAMVLRDTGQAEKAQGYFLEAIRLEPKQVPYRVNLGNLLWDMGRTAEAEDILRMAYEEAPDLPYALFSWVQFLVKSGKIDEGKKILTGKAGYLQEDYYKAQIADFLSEKDIPEPLRLKNKGSSS